MGTDNIFSLNSKFVCSTLLLKSSWCSSKARITHKSFNSQKSSREQEAAWEFITYMLSHPEEYLAEVGLIQPTKALMSSETFKNIPYGDVFADDLAKGHMVYYAENSAKIQELMKEAVEGVLLSGIAPEKALASLKVKAQEVLDQQ